MVAHLGPVPGSAAGIPNTRMDFALEKHLPSRLFIINELTFSNIFCPLAAPAVTPNLLSHQVWGTTTDKF